MGGRGSGMNPVDLILSKLFDAKRNGTGWQARCPAHDDRRPSLSIAEGDGGRALVTCHAGCTPEEVAAAIGLKMADLMPPRSAASPRKPGGKPLSGPGGGRLKPPTAGNTPRATTGPSEAPTFPTASDAVAALERQHGKRAATWTYHNAQGEPVGVVVRWNLADGNKDIRPVRRTPGGWTIGGMPEPRPLYRLPELLARPGERVFVCEGERAADAAASMELLATSSPHGSKSAGKADWRTLAGREVVILPDADDAGRQYSDAVAGILAGLNPPASVRVVELPELPEGGDFVEYLAARPGTTPEAIRAEVEALADAAEVTKPPDRGGPVLVCLADVEPREVRWLWPGRVPLGRITLLVGRPGEGKSFLATDMTARVTTGTPWPDGSPCPSGSVILVSAEDDPADTIRPRLDAHGADVRRVHLLSAVRYLDDDGKPQEMMFTLADVAVLEAALQARPDCKLIVVDPIGSFMGGKVDAHRDNEVRGVLAPVAKLAEKYGAAVVVVAHQRKSPGTIADDLALGSRAFTGIARAVWHLMRDAEDKGRRLLLPGKNNLAPEGTGLAFGIFGDPPAIAWEPEPVTMSADDALAVENGNGKAEKRGPEPEARNAAAEWLRRVLSGGPVATAKVKDEAKAAEYAWRTVQRAADELRVERRKAGYGEGWTWELPAEDANQTCQPPQAEKNLASWHLRENIGKNTDSEPGILEDAKLNYLGTLGADEPEAPANDDGEWGEL